MKYKTSKILISLVIIASVNSNAFAESLFKTGVAQDVYSMQPRSLFGTVKARTIGDLITVAINENVSLSDNLQLDVKKSSTITDNFSAKINDIVHNFVPWTIVPNVNGFGGGVSSGDKTSITRQAKFTNTITAQVVQVLGNGNLVIQGKKSTVNAGEKMDVVLSGVVDPRLLDSTGKIDSSLVANLQFGIVGKGTISRSDSTGPVNNFVRRLF